MSWSIEALNPEDQKLLQRQEDVVNSLLVSLGEVPLTGSRQDCRKIQFILDSKTLTKADIWKLQCLGISLGNVMEHLLGLHWVMINDEYGRDPALRFQNTSLIIYPLTMISKRVERDEPVNALDLLKLTASHVKQLGHEIT